MDFSFVPTLLQEACDTCMLPRRRQLLDSQIEEKSPGEMVTVVDREMEALVARELVRIVPDSIVVGEEACAANPGLMDQLPSGRRWLLDPLDGTGNFIAGRDEFAVLLGYLEDGMCVASWLYRPVDRMLYAARRGEGATLNGHAFVAAATASCGRGIVKTRFLPQPMREKVIERANARLAQVLPGANCTAYDYPDVLNGEADFALYWRTLPWDHAPCVLLLEEAGGVARRLDGAVYRPCDGLEGLLIAADERRWLEARAVLLD